MDAIGTEPRPSSPGPEVETSKGLGTAATQRLLGDTITVGDPDWRAPSALPGWSRGHVATHLARQADALGRLVKGALSGQPQQMYASAGQRARDIELGASRTGLQLQIDLDTAAGALAHGFDAVAEADAWERVVELRGGDQVPLRMLPLARLSEVVLHHVDLDIGFATGDVAGRTAEWLLEWCAFRLHNRSEFPRLHLVADSGFEQSVGSRGEARVVSGTSSALLGWLTRRDGPAALSGAEGVVLPSFG